MKKFSTFLIVAFAAALLALVPEAKAAEITISIGDRPYMSRGYSYWNNGVNWYWVPGHWGPRKKYWIKGHYARRSHSWHLKNRPHKIHKKIHRALHGW